MKNNEQSQGRESSSARTLEHAQVHENRNNIATATTDEQPGDDCLTPSACFIGGQNSPELTAKQVTELGLNIYNLEEKNMKMKVHSEFLKTCLEKSIVPKGLLINKSSATGAEDEIFRKKWNDILNDCSLKLTECLVEHYEMQLPQNAYKTADTYESLEKEDLWTDNDRRQLEEELHSVLDPKEKELKEEKQKKLETVRTKKTKERAPRSDTETYADVPKRS